MRTIWHSLLWKEWHEHKWKLAAMATILLVVPILCLLFFQLENLFESVTATLIAYGVLAGLFLSMSTAAGENSRSTMPFLQSLPLPMWKPAATKLGWAAVTVTVPILLVVGFVYGICLYWYWMGVDYLGAIRLDAGHSPLGGSNWFVARIVMGSLAALSLLVWGAATGVNRRDEVRAGAIGILVIVVIAIGTPVAYGYWYVARETGFRNSEQMLFIPFALVFLVLYCWSVAAICLVRQPIYAAVLSMASVLMVPGLVYAFHHLQ